MSQARQSFLATWALELLLILYLLASLLHFFHNAEFAQAYPNLPSWVTRSSVYGTWFLITMGGALGYVLLRIGRRVIGFAILCVYAAVGLDGLLHYARAPVGAHTHGMNFTIWFEAASAAILLTFLLVRAKRITAP